MPLPFSADALLQGIDGVAYVVDGDGVIMGISGRPFSGQGNESLAKPQDNSQLIGTSLFALTHGAAVRQSYITLHNSVWFGSGTTVGFVYRCDSPAIERHVYMPISRIMTDGIPVAVLYQSIVMSEIPRPPLPLFAFEFLAADRPRASLAAFVTLCSFCQRVEAPMTAASAEAEWIEAVEFYRRGGRSDIAVTHGLCEACFLRVVEPVSDPKLPATSAGMSCSSA